ncbi:calcium/calmodulin-dependent protein kinase [Exophiala viscosa]|uniref:calcium/calmodulin-dependent protein kinase n=1 Tax=Exophiala viscosa TaxID=2486360 RepID=UPI00219C64DF|nr:calcium/calmodulin-dependent protein kinase [Exophiala viscosa]
MPDDVSITWDPKLQQAHANKAKMSVGASNDLEPETGYRDETDSNTQRNTPKALSAQEPPGVIDEQGFPGLNGQLEYGVTGSPGFGPLKAQQSLPSSTQNSSNSLKSMSAQEDNRNVGIGGAFVNRGLSTRSSHGQIRGRRPSHSKSFSASRSRPNDSHPTYPAQSLATLQASFASSPRPAHPLRTRSSHPAQTLLYNEMSVWMKQSREQQTVSDNTRTADNTPMSSPGLFNPDDPQPQLHHLQLPRETHTVEIEHDTFTGNKFINNYEIVQELGRGEHGKVKLGRDIEKGTLVAVKIVPRYSAKRRLGRLGAPEDRTKREVAILKKARHPNVVSLLEVIDDPNKNKVYLILEYVEKSEIKWRKPGVREVLAVNNNRFSQERVGNEVPLEVSEKDSFIVAQAARRHDLQQQERARLSNARNVPHWSLEHGGDDEEDEFSDISRSASRTFYPSSPSRTSSHDGYSSSVLAGSMYGAYVPESYRDRKFSIANSAVSHMSSEFNFDESDDEHGFVPALTLEEARRAFRDTLCGLEFLHFIGIIHRDIKPANLLVSASGNVKISDFGVSYLGRPTTEEDSENALTEKDVSTLDDEKELARSVGTPAFWAPELCYEDPSMFEEKDGPRITGALDLWALGITLYCMIYARLPFYANDEMGLHEAVCRAEVFCPKSRLIPVDTSRDKPSNHVPSSINCNKRLDYELKFEPIPDAVRDLISKLLIKDPAKRMTIKEAKKHEWVVEGMVDPGKWIRGPDELAKDSKKKILEIDDKELSHAVGKRNIIERALNTAGRIAGSLLGRSNTRRRAPSSATSASQSSESIASPSGSSASTVGKTDRDRIGDARRSSLRGDELLAALKTSRENSEHPLAQSQTASPDESPRDRYFYEPSIASAAVSPMDERQSRPRGPDRAASAISTAESVRTIRASQMQRMPLPHSETLPELERQVLPDRGIKAMVDGLWEGTTRTLGRLGSRDRRSQRGDQSPAPSRHSSEGDAHAGASIAVSTASAAGSIEPPEALRGSVGVVSPIDYNTAPRESAGMNIQNQRSTVQAPASSHGAFEQAREVNQRRLIQEANFQAEAAAEAASRPQSQPVPDECPPSPDDIAFLEKQRTRPTNEPSPFSIDSIQGGPSASTIASSLDGYEASSVSHSMSNPSFGIISSASSPPGEGYYHTDPAEVPRDGTLSAKDAEPDFMRTADTIIKHGRLQQHATGAALEDWPVHSYDDDHDGYSDDDSDEEGIVMGSSHKKL